MPTDETTEALIARLEDTALRESNAALVEALRGIRRAIGTAEGLLRERPPTADPFDETDKLIVMLREWQRMCSAALKGRDDDK